MLVRTLVGTPVITHTVHHQTLLTTVHHQPQYNITSKQIEAHRLPKSKMIVNSTAKPTFAQYSIVRSLVERKILLQKADKLLKDVQAMFKNEPELFSNKLDVQNVLKHFDDSSNDSDNIIRQEVRDLSESRFVFPIHFAVSLGDVEMVRFILDKKHIHLAGYKKKQFLLFLIFMVITLLILRLKTNQSIW